MTQDNHGSGHRALSLANHRDTGPRFGGGRCRRGFGALIAIGDNAGGATLFAALGMMLVIGASVGLLMWTAQQNRHTAERLAASSEAFNAAEAAMRRAMVILDATDNWVDMTNTYPVLQSWTNINENTQYEIVVTNLTQLSARVIGTGRRTFRDITIDRKVTGLYRRALTEPFTYAYFAAQIRMNNDMWVDIPFTNTFPMFSNEDILFDAGIACSGRVRAVSNIVAGTGTVENGLSDTVLLGRPRDNQHDSPYNATNFGEAPPTTLITPFYDWDRIEGIASNEGTWHADSNAFFAFIADDSNPEVTIATNAVPWAYAFPCPQAPDGTNNTISLGINYGDTPGIVRKTTVTGIHFIDGDLDINVSPSATEEAVLIMTNAALIAIGDITIRGPFEIYGTPEHPALACDGELKIKWGDGPTHIEGITFVTEQVHFRRVDRPNDYGEIYIKGTVAANEIRSDQHFLVEYQEWPDITGFSFFGNFGGLSLWQEIPTGQSSTFTNDPTL